MRIGFFAPGGNVESRIKVLGHPLHPMLVVFPVGLLVTSACVDVFAFWRQMAALALAQLNIGVGLPIGIIAMSVGWLDWLAIPEKTRAKRIGAIHGVSNMLAIVMFGIVWIMRRGYSMTMLPTWLIVVEVAGLLTILFAGWLGGDWSIGSEWASMEALT